MGIENWQVAPKPPQIYESREDHLKRKVVDLITEKKLYRSAIASGIGMGVAVSAAFVFKNSDVTLLSGYLTGINVGKDIMLISVREGIKKGGYPKILK